MGNLYLFLTTVLIINLTPGPAMMFCLNQAQHNGIKSGTLAALGVEAGVFVYAVATAFGLGMFFVEYPKIFKLIQMIGFAYLLFLAYQSWPRKKTSLPMNMPFKKALHPFFKGFFINLSNPKIGLFFISLLPQFVSNYQKNAQLIFIFYGLVFNLGGFIVNMTVVLTTKQTVHFIKKTNRYWMNYIPSILFVLIAIKVCIGEF